MLTTAIYRGLLSWCWTKLAFSLIMKVSEVASDEHPGSFKPTHSSRWTGGSQLQINWVGHSSRWTGWVGTEHHSIQHDWNVRHLNISTCLPAVSVCLAYLHVDMVQFSSCWLHLCLWPCSLSDRSHVHGSTFSTFHPENQSSHKNRLNKTCPLGSIPWPFTFRAACLINQMVKDFH